MLELLDQVEDVISVEDLASKKVEAPGCQVQDRNGGETPLKADLAVKRVATHLPEMVKGELSHYNLLVLEVCFIIIASWLLVNG